MGEVIKMHEEPEIKTVTFVGTPRECEHVAHTFFESQRLYVEQMTEELDEETREAYRDAMEREVWEITFTPKNMRSINQIREGFMDGSS